MMPNVTDLYAGRLPDMRVPFEEEPRQHRRRREQRRDGTLARLAHVAGRLLAMLF